jgi:peptidoglycan/LPS O-acetylase OafA/YrhL
LIKNKDKTEFLKRRIFRIFPPYFLTLFVIFALAFIDKGLGEKILSIKDILISFPFFFYNYAKLSTNGVVPGMLNIFWSLCFEEQFYVVLFLLSLFCPKKIHFFIWAGLLYSLGLRIYMAVANIVPDGLSLQMKTHYRLDAILLGCLIYFYWDRIEKYFKYTFLNLMLVLLAIILHNTSDRYQGLTYILISASFTGLVFHLLSTKGKKYQSYLANKVLSFIGIISFEIYLIHEIVIGLAVKLKLSPHPLLFIIFTYSVSIGLAWLFHKLFSQWTNQKLRKQFIVNA